METTFKTNFKTGKKLFERRYHESSQKPAFMTSSLSPKQNDKPKVQESIKPMPQLKHGVSEGKADYLKTSKTFFYPLEKHKVSSKVLLPTKPHDSGTMKDPNYPETRSRLELNSTARSPPGSAEQKSRSMIKTADSNLRKNLNSRKSDKTVKFQIKKQTMNKSKQSNFSNNIMVASNATAQNQYYQNNNISEIKQEDQLNLDYFNQTDQSRPVSQQIERPFSKQTLDSASQRPIGSSQSNRFSNYSSFGGIRPTSRNSRSQHAFTNYCTPSDYFQNFMEQKKEIFNEGKKLSRMSQRSQNNNTTFSRTNDTENFSPKQFVTQNIAQIEAEYIVKPARIDLDADQFLKKNNILYKNKFKNQFIKDEMHKKIQNKIMNNSTFQYNCLMKSNNLKRNYNQNSTLNSHRSNTKRTLQALSNTTQGFHRRNITQKVEQDFYEGYGNNLDNFDQNISFSKKSHQELNQGSTFYNDIKNRIN